MKDSILIYSGGMDSTTLLYDKQDSIALGVTFNYGSKHNDVEYIFAAVNTTQLGIPHIRFDLSPIMGQHFESALLQSGEDVPYGHYEEPTMKKTVVPFRNGIMLSLAAGLAESKGLKKVLYANHQGDHAIYPDCRDIFYTAFSEAIRLGTYAEIELQSPYLQLDKRGIGLRGQELGVNWAQTWTCYEGLKVYPKHCGKCGACVERKEALEGFDPTEYED